MPDYFDTGWSYLFFLFFRVFNSGTVATSFDPDEYWQSLEVAHNYVFGYGYLTWEWQAAIRGFLHPGIFAMVFWVLKFLGLDSPFLVVLAPKILQAIFVAIYDYFLYHLADKLFGKSTAHWTLIFNLSSWFIYFCLVRTYSNTMETILTVVALYYWPWTITNKKRGENIYLGLLIAAISCVIRPTNAVLWIWMGCRTLMQISSWASRLKFLLQAVIPIGVFSFLLSSGVDWLFYQNFNNVIWNFISLNLLSDLASQYGTHPWHWYLSSGFPTMLASYTPLFVASFVWNRHALHFLIFFFIGVFSLAGHKEFRFVLPVLPLALILSAKFVADNYKPKARNILLFLLIATNLGMALYLTQAHQRGVIDVVHYIRQDETIQTVDFLMPCHATPYYAYIHRNLSLSFLTCPPTFSPSDPVAEWDIFKKLETPQQGVEFLGIRYATGKLPSHVVLFDDTLPVLDLFLHNNGYTEFLPFPFWRPQEGPHVSQTELKQQNV